MHRFQTVKTNLCKDCPRYTQKRCTPSDLGAYSHVDVLFVDVQPDSFAACNDAPFYGHGGKVIRTAIDSLRASKETYRELSLRYTYTVQCMDEKDENPSKAVLQHCRPLLLSTINSIPPKMVVAMGADTARQLGFKQPFNDIRGRVSQLPTNPSIPVFVTFGSKALLAKR